MKKIGINDLTEEIKAKIPAYKERCVVDLYSGNEWDNFNPQKSESYIDKIYEIAGKKKPVVIFSDDPLEYKKKYIAIQNSNIINKIHETFVVKNQENGDVTSLYNELHELISTYKENDNDKNIEVKSNYLYLCSLYSRIYLTWYKFIQDEFNVEHENKELLDWLYENANNNIARCYFEEEYVLVLKTPKYIRKNNGTLHSTKEAAIDWPNYKMYYINGRRISEDLFNKTLNNTLTFEEFMSIDNDDVKANIITMIKENDGNEKLMNFLDAKVVDEQKIEHSSGHVETLRLWKTNKSFEFVNDINGNTNQPYAWLEETCPSTGSVYLIDTSAHFENAIDAAKFHRPQFIPTELKYDFNEFNN
jgi:hypothetical protein